MAPDHACSVNSVAGRPDHGPSSPNGVIDVTIRCGWARSRSRGASMGCSATSEPRDHTTVSAEARSECSESRLSGLWASTTTLCFDAPRKLNRAPSRSGEIGAPEADHRRSGSPSGASTLITSAPPSASSFVQYAPPTHVERSTTRSPLSGGTGSVLSVTAASDCVAVNLLRDAGVRIGSNATPEGTCRHCPLPPGSDRRPSSPGSGSPARHRRLPGGPRPSTRARR